MVRVSKKRLDTAVQRCRHLFFNLVLLTSSCTQRDYLINHLLFQSSWFCLWRLIPFERCVNRLFHPLVFMMTCYGPCFQDATRHRSSIVQIHFIPGFLTFSSLSSFLVSQVCNADFSQLHFRYRVSGVTLPDVTMSPYAMWYPIRVCRLSSAKHRS